jgi:hypothetical protein
VRTGIRHAPRKGCRAWNNWYALFVPAKTPLDTINAINEAVRRTHAIEAYLNEPPEW